MTISVREGGGGETSHCWRILLLLVFCFFIQANVNMIFDQNELAKFRVLFCSTFFKKCICSLKRNCE